MIAQDDKEVFTLQRWQLPEDASSFITGQTLPVDGGATTVYQGNFPSIAQGIGNRFIAGLVQI